MLNFSGIDLRNITKRLVLLGEIFPVFRTFVQSVCADFLYIAVHTKPRGKREKFHYVTKWRQKEKQKNPQSRKGTEGLGQQELSVVRLVCDNGICTLYGDPAMLEAGFRFFHADQIFRDGGRKNLVCFRLKQSFR